MLRVSADDNGQKTNETKYLKRSSPGTIPWYNTEWQSIERRAEQQAAMQRFRARAGLRDSTKGRWNERKGGRIKQREGREE